MTSTQAVGYTKLTYNPALTFPAFVDKNIWPAENTLELIKHNKSYLAEGILGENSSFGLSTKSMYEKSKNLPPNKVKVDYFIREYKGRSLLVWSIRGEGVRGYLVIAPDKLTLAPGWAAGFDLDDAKKIYKLPKDNIGVVWEEYSLSPLIDKLTQ